MSFNSMKPLLKTELTGGTSLKASATLRSALVACLVALACQACGVDMAEEAGGGGPEAVGVASQGLKGGSPMAHSRIGVYRIDTYDGSVQLGSCTATLVYSSQVTNRSWLVTAAHCFSYVDSAHSVTGHASDPRAAVTGSVPATAPANSKVFVHPDWLNHGGLTAWFGPRDVAFIYVDRFIEVRRPNASGTEQVVPEFRRAVYTGPSAPAVEPVRMSPLDTRVFCGHGNPSSLNCDTLKNLWYSPGFRSEFFQLPQAAWNNRRADPPFEPGDSGGPLLVYAPDRSSHPWSLLNLGNAETATRDGVVMGVLQGPTVFCDYIQNGNCNPLDGLAATFAGMDDWLDTLPKGRLIPRNGLCPSNAQATRGSPMPSTCTCQSDATTQGSVWGTGTYTDDSRLCRAAVHAGVLSIAGGNIKYMNTPGLPVYQGTTANGVTSASYGYWGGSVTFAGACPTNAVSDRSQVFALRSCYCTATRTQTGAVWGTNIYTDDSSLCRAALHAGQVTASGGDVYYQIMPGMSSYAGSSRNGVTSWAYGFWPGAYRFYSSP